MPAVEPTAATITPEVPKEETKPAVEEKPKPTKRGSIFGSFVEKLKSPTTEKKESEVGPAPPAKEPEVCAMLSVSLRRLSLFNQNEGRTSLTSI